MMAYPPNFKISLGMPSGPTGFFLPVADNILIMLILMVKGLPDSVE
jgi:hypothetical protein